MPGEVEAAVLVEILVLGGEEGVDHHLRHRLDRDVEPALAWHIRRPASRRSHARASSPAARSPAAANSPAGPWRNARAGRRRAPTPTRNTIVPAANRKPKKRSSSLHCRVPTSRQPRRSPQRRRIARSCRSRRKARCTARARQARLTPPQRPQVAVFMLKLRLYRLIAARSSRPAAPAIRVPK